MIAAVVAAIMAASFFMPWVDFFGETMNPQSLVDGSLIQMSDIPWRGWAFVASFAIAALAAVQAVMGRAAGVLMLIAGAIPYGLIGEQVLSVRGQAADLGVPLPSGGDPMQALERAREFVSYGAPAYFIAAALLVVIGLVRAVRGA